MSSRMAPSIPAALTITSAVSVGWEWAKGATLFKAADNHRWQGDKDINNALHVFRTSDKPFTFYNLQDKPMHWKKLRNWEDNAYIEVITYINVTLLSYTSYKTGVKS